jgi:hypothetical protein
MVHTNCPWGVWGRLGGTSGVQCFCFHTWVLCSWPVWEHTWAAWHCVPSVFHLCPPPRGHRPALGQAWASPILLCCHSAFRLALNFFIFQTALIIKLRSSLSFSKPWYAEICMRCLLYQPTPLSSCGPQGGFNVALLSLHFISCVGCVFVI